MFTLLEKCQKREKLLHDAQAIKNKADAEKRAMSAEDNQTFDRMMDEFDALGKEVQREERAARAAAELEKPLTPFHEISHGAGREARDQRGLVAPITKEQIERNKVVRSFLQTGPTGNMEFRALQADSATAGGTLFQREQFVNRLIKFIDDQVFIRGMATVIPVTNSDALGVPTLETDIADADWTTEILTGSADASMAVGKRVLQVHALAKQILISNKLIRTAAIDVEGLVAQRLAYKFAVTQEKAFISGTGVQQPLGAFVAHASGVTTARDTTTTAAAAVKADDLFSAFYSLKQQYQRNAVWVMNRDTVAAIRKLKDNNNNYLYSVNPMAASSLTQTAYVDSLLGRPVVMSEYAPSYAGGSGTYVAVLADWSFYWIAESLGMQLQKLVELYAATNQVGFIGRMEFDGAPVLAEAFARIKLQ